ncbi:MAG: sigma-70 family RNA polymerase sigma factor [Clostridiales bacterium]|jgi:RNA polymerase sigma-70 factor (ECF subfamily)|nr:sigma-70 family RNA polymerase sigma factor [Clostridiales bacterium]
MEKTNAYLFTRAKENDVSAFEELISPYEKLVYNIARRILVNEEDAKDISQEVWLKVYKNISKCKDAGSFKAWVCTIANNSCLDFLRRRKARIQPSSMDKIFQNEDGESDIPVEDKTQIPPEDALIASERKKAIINAINSLGYTHKIMIVYRDLNGLSYEEIAKITGVNIGTVKSQISRARGALKKILVEMKEHEKI